MTFVLLLNKSSQNAQFSSICEERKLRIAISYLCWTAGPETYNKTLDVFYGGASALPWRIQNYISSVQWSRNQASLAAKVLTVYAARRQKHRPECDSIIYFSKRSM